MDVVSTRARLRAREEGHWVIVGVCQVSSALCDRKHSDSSPAPSFILEWSVSQMPHITPLPCTVLSFLLESFISAFSSVSSQFSISLSPPLGCHFTAYGSPTQQLPHSIRTFSDAITVISNFFSLFLNIKQPTHSYLYQVIMKRI